MSIPTCPTCGAVAHVKAHHIGERASFEPGKPAAAVRVTCCGICAIEARRQLDAANAAEVIDEGDVTRADAVADALVY